MATTSTSETTFTVRRLNVAIPDVRGFQRSYEAAVPEVPQEQVSVLVHGGAPWSEMLELADRILRSPRLPHLQQA
jgi:hypothetical protein